MRLYEVLDLMHQSNEVLIKERYSETGAKTLYLGKVDEALRNPDLDISREVLSIRPQTTNRIQLFLED